MFSYFWGRWIRGVKISYLLQIWIFSYFILYLRKLDFMKYLFILLGTLFLVSCKSEYGCTVKIVKELSESGTYKVEYLYDGYYDKRSRECVIFEEFEASGGYFPGALGYPTDE